jgi:hypothetical protein
MESIVNIAWILFGSGITVINLLSTYLCKKIYKGDRVSLKKDGIFFCIVKYSMQDHKMLVFMSNSFASGYVIAFHIC